MALDDLASAFERFLAPIEAEMRAVVNAGTQPALFNIMLNYHLGFADEHGHAVSARAGKRIRPVLTLLSCEACGGDWRMALPAAAAVELLHNFSLIHDDIEDRDELRRGRPTVWKLWGEAQAINAGDAMFALSHLALLRCAEAGARPAQVVQALRVFDEMCVQLTVGQHLDLSFETRNDVSTEEYLAMIGGKTAALIAAACRIGALCADATEAHADALEQFGRGLGVAFQLQDDVLGIWGDPVTTGKHSSDLVHRKKTLPVIFAAERDPALRARYFDDLRPLSPEEVETIRARIERLGGRQYAESMAEQAYTQAVEALQRLPYTPARESLAALARALLNRQA